MRTHLAVPLCAIVFSSAAMASSRPQAQAHASGEQHRSASEGKVFHVDDEAVHFTSPGGVTKLNLKDLQIVGKQWSGAGGRNEIYLHDAKSGLVYTGTAEHDKVLEASDVTANSMGGLSRIVEGPAADPSRGSPGKVVVADKETVRFRSPGGVTTLKLNDLVLVGAHVNGPSGSSNIVFQDKTSGRMYTGITKADQNIAQFSDGVNKAEFMANLSGIVEGPVRE